MGTAHSNRDPISTRGNVQLLSREAFTNLVKLIVFQFSVKRIYFVSFLLRLSVWENYKKSQRTAAVPHSLGCARGEGPSARAEAGMWDELVELQLELPLGPYPAGGHAAHLRTHHKPLPVKLGSADFFILGTAFMQEPQVFIGQARINSNTDPSPASDLCDVKYAGSVCPFPEEEEGEWDEPGFVSWGWSI